jgi:hypothetical protein
MFRGVMMQPHALHLLDLATSRHHDGGMPDWNRLKEHAINRRVELGHPNRDSFVTASGISARILGDIERADRTSYSRTTLAKLERALHWAPGSIRTILDGGNPTPADPGHITATLPALTANATASPSDPILRILNADIPPTVKEQIVKQLLAEQQQFAQQRVDELLHNATHTH